MAGGVVALEVAVLEAGECTEEADDDVLAHGLAHHHI